MDEFETDEAAKLPQGSATSPRWTVAASIELAHRLNEQCVELRIRNHFLLLGTPAIRPAEPRPVASS
jgi:hypothetical protein